MSNKIKLLCASIVLLSGCNQDSNSDVASLDQFAGSDAQYFCSGPFTDNTDSYIKKYVAESDKLTAGQTAAISQALSAIPTHIKDKAFSGHARSFIKVTDDINSDCIEPTAAIKGNKPFRSCHRVEEGQVTIYIDSNPNEIKKGLVRAIGYYLSEVDLRIDTKALSDELTLVLLKDTKDISEEKSRVALSFLEDVDRSKNIDLGVFKGMLHNNVLAAKIGYKERQKRWLALKGNDLIVRDLFADYIVAEAFDSAYCSDRSRSVMENAFPITSQALTAKNFAEKGCEICKYFTAAAGLNLAGQTAGRRNPTLANPIARPKPVSFEQKMRNLAQYPDFATQIKAAGIQPNYTVAGGQYQYFQNNQWAWVNNKGQRTGQGVSLTRDKNNKLAWQPITPSFNPTTASFENYIIGGSYQQTSGEDPGKGSEFVWNNPKGDTTFQTKGNGQTYDTQYIATKTDTGYENSIRYDGLIGEYKTQADGSNVWYDGDGNKTSYTASKDSSGAWNYTGSIGGQQPTGGSATSGLFNSPLSNTSMNQSADNIQNNAPITLPSSMSGPPVNEGEPVSLPATMSGP